MVELDDSNSKSNNDNNSDGESESESDGNNIDIDTDDNKDTNNESLNGFWLAKINLSREKSVSKVYSRAMMAFIELGREKCVDERARQ